MTGTATTILHLSDIHLRRSEIESPEDLDADIRNELLRDLASLTLTLEDGIHAVVVTGDVAFAGEPVEFDSARSWLLGLCKATGCPPEQVWIVPGNHDVDRGAIERSSVLQAIHEGIRRADRPAAALHKHLCDPTGAEALLTPLQAYNRFAEQFRSESTPRAVAWTSSESDLVLNDGSCLRVRGLNSTLISSRHDSDTSHKLVIGHGQLTIPRQPGVTWMTLCHHPPRWLMDEHEVADYLDSRVSVQFFGHEHRQRVQSYDAGIRVYAGALHPSRGESDWCPKYNILRLAVEGESTNRALAVEVYEREWKQSQTMFGPAVGGDGQYPRKFRITLPPWFPPSPVPSDRAVEEQLLENVVVETSDAVDTKRDEVLVDDNAPKQLVFQFFKVPYPTRMKLLLELGLLWDEDAETPESELLRRVVARARDGGSLNELEAAVAGRVPKNSEAT